MTDFNSLLALDIMATIFSSEAVMEASHFSVCRSWYNMFSQPEWMAAFLHGKYGLVEALNVLMISERPVAELRSIATALIIKSHSELSSEQYGYSLIDSASNYTGNGLGPVAEVLLEHGETFIRMDGFSLDSCLPIVISCTEIEAAPRYSLVSGLMQLHELAKSIKVLQKKQLSDFGFSMALIAAAGHPSDDTAMGKLLLAHGAGRVINRCTLGSAAAQGNVKMMELLLDQLSGSKDQESIQYALPLATSEQAIALLQPFM